MDCSTRKIPSTIPRCVAVYGKNEKGHHLINDLKMGRRIGKGAHVAVRRATDVQGNIFALRVLHIMSCQRKQVAKFAKGGDVEVVSLLERVKEELDLHWGFDHPCIVQLNEVIEDNLHHVWFIRMEYLGGGKCMKFLQKYCAYSARPTDDGVFVYTEYGAARIVYDLLSGLAYLHKLGIVHKDIKPENLLLVQPPPFSWLKRIDVPIYEVAEIDSCSSTESVDSENSFNSTDTECFLWETFSEPSVNYSDVVYNGDPGMYYPRKSEDGTMTLQNRMSPVVAKVVDFNSAAKLGSDGEIWDAEGTRLFTPPECLNSLNAGIDGKARDMWSVGCLTYCLLSGAPPMWSSDQLELTLKIMEYTSPIFPSLDSGACCRLRFSCELSEDAKSFVSALLCVDPRKRATVENALNHQWLVGVAAESTSSGKHC